MSAYISRVSLVAVFYILSMQSQYWNMQWNQTIKISAQSAIHSKCCTSGCCSPLNLVIDVILPVCRTVRFLIAYLWLWQQSISVLWFFAVPFRLSDVSRWRQSLSSPIVFNVADGGETRSRPSLIVFPPVSPVPSPLSTLPRRLPFYLCQIAASAPRREAPQT